eukprot:scaffold8896_cov67-Phaeocystis_antarctica.AAC.4
MAEGSSTAMEIEDAPEMSHKQKTREAQIASLPWVEKCASAMCSSSLRPLCTHLGADSTRAGKLPHLLLYGPPGTGKTSTILACAHKLYGKHFQSMVLELNASDDRGIDGNRLRRNPPSRMPSRVLQPVC